MGIRMTDKESIRLYVYEDGDVSLTKIPSNLRPTPFGILFNLTEIGGGRLDAELISYGCDQTEVTEAIVAVMNSDPCEEIIVGKV